MTTLYQLSPDLTTVLATYTSAQALGPTTGIAYNDNTQSLWIASQNSRFVREVRVVGSEFEPTGRFFRAGFQPHGLDYSPELDLFLVGEFDARALYAITADGEVAPGYPVSVEGRSGGGTSNSPGLSFTQGLLEMTSRSSRSFQAGQFGLTVPGQEVFNLPELTYGLKRSRLDPNGVLYLTTRTSGGSASVVAVDPPDLPPGVGTPIQVLTPFFSTELLAPGAEAAVPTSVNGRVLVEGQADSEIFFLTNTPSNPIIRLPIRITVRNVAGEDGPAELLSGASTYPNPVRGAARVSVTLGAAETVTVDLYNTLGQRVAVLADAAPMAAGETTLALPAGSLAAGVYVVRVQAGTSVSTHKVTVIR